MGEDPALNQGVTGGAESVGVVSQNVSTYWSASRGESCEVPPA